MQYLMVETEVTFPQQLNHQNQNLMNLKYWTEPYQTTAKSDIIVGFGNSAHFSGNVGGIAKIPSKYVYICGSTTKFHCLSNEFDWPGDPADSSEDKKEYYHVIVPTTPNPTSAYLLFISKKEVKETDISIDEGIKTILSGGVIHPGKNNI